MHRSTITSLAILKVNYEALGRDYIQNFVPLVAEVIRGGADDVISVSVVQDGLRKQFGLSLPLNPIRQILRRAARAGLLRRESGVFCRADGLAHDTTFSDTRDDIIADIAAVVAALREFASSHHRAEWTEERAEAGLLGFLGDSGLDVLYASAERRLIAESPISQADRYVVGSFVRHTQVSAPAEFARVETIARGILLVNALYLPDPAKVGERFRNTTAYLDTSIPVFALGHAGPDRQAPPVELLELLKRYGARLRCFTHTVDEIRSILDVHANQLKRGNLKNAYGPVVEYCVSQGLTSTDIDLLSARVPTHLTLMGVEVVDRPEHDRDYQIGRLAHHIGRVVECAVSSVTIVVLGVGLVFSFPWNLPPPRASVLQYGVGFAFIALFGFTVFSI